MCVCVCVCVCRTHMQDLQEVTQDLHYENFRSERLKRAGRYGKSTNKLSRRSSSCTWTDLWVNVWCTLCSRRAADEDVLDKDQILMEKEAEVGHNVYASEFGILAID